MLYISLVFKEHVISTHLYYLENNLFQHYGTRIVLILLVELRKNMKYYTKNKHCVVCHKELNHGLQKRSAPPQYLPLKKEKFKSVPIVMFMFFFKPHIFEITPKTRFRLFLNL